MALVAAELGSAIPEGGGLFPLGAARPGRVLELPDRLVVDAFAVRRLGRLHRSRAGLHHQQVAHDDNWRWLLGIGLVAIFTFINIRGLDITGKALTVIQVVVMVPFVLLVIWAFAKGTGNPVSPFLPPGVNVFCGDQSGPGDHDVDVLGLRVHVDAGRRGREPAEADPAGHHDRRTDRDRHLRAHDHGRHHGGRQGQLGQHGLRRQRRRSPGRLRQGRPDRRRRLPAVGAVRVGDRQQPRPLHGLPGKRLAALVSALARPPLPALHGQGPQALGHAVGRDPHHGRRSTPSSSSTASPR